MTSHRQAFGVVTRTHGHIRGSQANADEQRDGVEHHAADGQTHVNEIACQAETDRLAERGDDARDAERVESCNKEPCIPMFMPTST